MIPSTIAYLQQSRRRTTPTQGASCGREVPAELLAATGSGSDPRHYRPRSATTHCSVISPLIKAIGIPIPGVVYEPE